MAQLTAPRLHRVPMRALGLSIIFAATMIAASVAVAQFAPSGSQAGVVSKTAANAPARVPHQAAPLE